MNAEALRLSAHKSTKELLSLARNVLTAARNGTWPGVGMVYESSQPEFVRQQLTHLEAEFVRQQLTHLEGVYGFRCGESEHRGLIEQAIPTFSRSGSTVRVAGVPGRCMHEAVLRLSHKILNSTYNTLDRALLDASAPDYVSRPANLNDVVPYWPKVKEALGAFPEEDWEMAGKILEHEYDNAADDEERYRELTTTPSSAPYLGIVIGDNRDAMRTLDGISLGPVEFDNKGKAWELFLALFTAGDAGISCSEAQERFCKPYDRKTEVQNLVNKMLRLDVRIDGKKWTLVHFPEPGKKSPGNR